MNRVVITGIGIVSPVGIGLEAFWSNLTAGRSGIGPIALFDAASFPVRIGAEVKGFDSSTLIQDFPEAQKVRDRKVLMALAAAKEAIADSKIPHAKLADAMLLTGVGLEAIWLEDLAVCANIGNQGGAAAESIYKSMGEQMLQTPLDCTNTLLGEHFGFECGKFTNCSACVAGAQAVGEAWQMLSQGQADVALAGATDSMLNPLGLGGFSILRVLSDENDTLQSACRPFDVTRKGTVLGEGAGFLLLEALDNAIGRNATIYAEVIGYGSSMDAFSVSDPDQTGQGAIACMRRALEEAQLEPQEVDCINAHGTGTIKNDIIETAAIKEVFGLHSYKIPVHSIKSMTGHMIAASGAIEAAASVLTLHRNLVPPTINLQKPDPECDLDYVAGTARVFAGNTVLSNSFGFGGQNASLIFRRFIK